MVGDVMCIIVACLLCLWLMFNVLAFISSYIWCSRQSRRKPKSIESMLDTKENPHCQFVNVKILAAEYFEGITRYTLGKVARIPSFKLRNLLYRGVFRMNITKRTVIYSGCEFRSPYHIKIGDSVIGPSNIIDGRCGVVIGNHVCTGSGVKIWTLQHDPQSKFFSVNGATVEIGHYSWIASFATVLPGRKIQEGAVISAGAIVTKDCEPYTIYAGIPAVKKGPRECDLSYELRRHWWFV
jgi:acetyltransferase-like isoleucine patch superfamily enzyme